MINLNGTVQRKFHFPSDPQTALHYFGELSRIVYLLPHISIVETYAADKVRIRYQTVELGAYTINIFCDLLGIVDPVKQTINVEPLDDCPKVKAESSLNTTTGYGYYSSFAHLYAEDGGTAIDYRLQFQAQLQRPRGLRMMPRRVVDRIAQSVSLGRVEEIADGFMEEAIEAFPSWLEEQNDQELAGQWLKSGNQSVSVRLAAGRQ